MKKKIIYIDMDGVLADFNAGVENHPLKDVAPYEKDPDLIPGLFANLPVIRGALDAVSQLDKDGRYELFVLSTAPWNNPSAWTDKRLWLEKHFGDIFRKKLILSHRKDLLMGDYLIDDMDTQYTRAFRGEWLWFGGGIYIDWNAVTQCLTGPV